MGGTDDHMTDATTRAEEVFAIVYGYVDRDGDIDAYDKAKALKKIGAVLAAVRRETWEEVADGKGSPTMLTRAQALEMDTIWQRAVGVCLGESCKREFISMERFEAVVVPSLAGKDQLIERLRAEVERLKVEMATMRRKKT